MYALTIVGSLCSIIGFIFAIYTYVNPNKKKK